MIFFLICNPTSSSVVVVMTLIFFFTFSVVKRIRNGIRGNTIVQTMIWWDRIEGSVSSQKEVKIDQIIKSPTMYRTKVYVYISENFNVFYIHHSSSPQPIKNHSFKTHSHQRIILFHAPIPHTVEECLAGRLSHKLFIPSMNSQTYTSGRSPSLHLSHQELVSPALISTITRIQDTHRHLTIVTEKAKSNSWLEKMTFNNFNSLQSFCAIEVLHRCV